MAFEKTTVPGYLKDEETNAVINTNMNEYTLYKMKRDKILKEQQEKETLAATVAELKQEFSEIKQLLLLALEKK